MFYFFIHKYWLVAKVVAVFRDVTIDHPLIASFAFKQTNRGVVKVFRHHCSKKTVKGNKSANVFTWKRRKVVQPIIVTIVVGTQFVRAAVLPSPLALEAGLALLLDEPVLVA